MKKRNICMLASAFALSLSLCACAGSDSDEAAVNAVVETENMADTEYDATDVDGDTATADSVQEESNESVDVESAEEVSGPQDIWEWVASIDATEPILTIWNDNNREGYIFQNNEKCILKEDDVICICIQEKETNLEIYSPMKSGEFRSYGTSDCKIFEFNKEFTSEYLFEFAMTIGGVEYPFSITLISESAADSASASTSEDTLSGKEWAATLEYDEPKLIVWNDEMGTKEVIDEGGTYQMQEGDVLGLYHGADYRPFTTEPYEFCEEFVMGMNFTIMEGCNLPEESQTINLGVEFHDVEVGDFFTYYFTITTP